MLLPNGKRLHPERLGGNAPDDLLDALGHVPEVAREFVAGQLGQVRPGLRNGHRLASLARAHQRSFKPSYCGASASAGSVGAAASEPRIPGKLVLEGVDEGQPARLDHVLGNAHRPPHRRLISGFDHDAHPRGRARAGVDHADLVINQVHFLEARVVPLQGLAQGAVEGVDRSIALADGVLETLADLELDGGLGERLTRPACRPR